MILSSEILNLNYEMVILPGRYLLFPLPRQGEGLWVRVK